MTRLLTTILLAGVLASCAGAGSLKPSIFTAPISYLESFPLNAITEDALIASAGPPDRTIEIAGKTAHAYELGENFGERTFTYVLDRGVVVDVIYNDHGPYNGSTARAIQGK